jgi:serine/threonine-protein kinase
MSGHSGAGPDELPRTIGRYKIQARLAGTSTDDVYRGFDPMIERPVVVKVFRLKLVDPAADAALKQAFYQEMQRAGLLMHHGIAALFDAGEEPGMLFMATEYVEGSNLAERLAEGITWDLAGRASIVVQVLDALDFAGQLGVPHLNLKPTNIVIGPGHAVKVGGFGVGSFVSRLAAASSAPAAPVSRYASPERARGEAGDERSDVYSAALIARDVFLGADPGSRLPGYLDGQGVDMSQLQAVLARALSANPADRYAAPESLKLELQLVLGVGDTTVWLDPHVPGAQGSVESAPEAVTILTPSGVYRLPDPSVDPIAASTTPDRAPDTADATTTMMQSPAKAKKS